MTSETRGAFSKHYGYNGFGRMTLAVIGDSIVNYEYDHAGLRTAKLIDGRRTELINNGTSVVAELTEGEIRNYYRGISLIGFEQNDEYYYYKLNAHGDTIGILDSFGQQVKEYLYDAFGNERNPDIFDTNPFRYCGEYFDNETGLIYLRARYYDPSIQKFVSEDPARDGYNWYAYCGNNPIKHIDPNGTYYIVEKKGKYHLEQETWFKLVARNIAEITPGGSMMVSVFERDFGVVGGTSAVQQSDVFSSTGLEILDNSTSSLESINKFKNIAKVSNKAIVAISIADTVVSLDKSIRTIDMDKIVFALMSNSSISLSANTQKELIYRYNKTQLFIELNYEYFFDRYINGKTQYEIDKSIKSSIWRDYSISKYVSDYKYKLENIATSGAFQFLGKIKEYTKEYSNYLRQYSERLELINSLYSDFMEE